MKISDEEVKAARASLFNDCGVMLSDTEISAAIEAALRVRKRLKFERELARALWA